MPTILFQYIKCDGSALSYPNPFSASSSFQYIKCDGSARFRIPNAGGLPHFNTSNVMVQQNTVYMCLSMCEYFNTSNVMVQH